MTSQSLAFRQIHLDFHVASAVFGVGKRFEKKAWQETLRRAEVASVTLFAKCHHGWSYHETKVGRRHPHLAFDLLRRQFDACREIGIKTPVYLSAGLDDLAAHEHPEWIELNAEGRPVRTPPLRAGFAKLCFHSPYLDYLCKQLKEVVALFPDCDAVFLDIISQNAGCSRWAMDYMASHGLDAASEADRQTAAEAALIRYYEQTTAACRSLNSDMPVVHNSGHLTRGRRDLLAFQSHLELESLPTGGWGYDHFPESACYAAGLGKRYIGMTGKFHTTWGEFGGYKHPNALRYECAAMLAFGAGCSVGDQPPPSAALDHSTYDLIGTAYREVKAKEPWCEGAALCAQIGVLSSAAERRSHARTNAADTGAARLLLEEHLPFMMLDREMALESFSLVIFPDDIRFDDELTAKVEKFLTAGGKICLSAESGLRKNGEGFSIDIGAVWEGPSPFEPDYVLARADVRPEVTASPFVHYLRSQRIRVTTGASLGAVYDPYFNRTFEHFSGHQHAPPREHPSGYDSGSLRGNVLYFAHPVFTAYRTIGHLTCRGYVAKALRLLLGRDVPVQANLPAAGRITVTRQPEHGRWIIHLLYAQPSSRGGEMKLDGGNAQSTGRSVEVIEDLVPLRHTTVSIKTSLPIRSVTLEPQGTSLAFKTENERVSFLVEEFTCHQMVVLQA